MNKPPNKPPTGFISETTKDETFKKALKIRQKKEARDGDRTRDLRLGKATLHH